MKLNIVYPRNTSSRQYYDQITHMIHLELEGGIHVTDGYHTFDELYAHRIELFIALCRTLYNMRGLYMRTGTSPDVLEVRGFAQVWRSKLHSDGTKFDGWFILGIGKEAGKQMTYHLPLDRWDDCHFAEKLEKAPEWDGHTANDVIERLKNL